VQSTVQRLRIAALVKQVPAIESMSLGPDGRLVREGMQLELNAYCRRAVSKGAELAAQSKGSLTIVSLGPPCAEDAVREGLAWASERGVDANGVLVTDPAFAGSDTLATARALAAGLQNAGPFDLILCGLNSIDSDTGQVGPEVAELLDLPFASGVRSLTVEAGKAFVQRQDDDGTIDAVIELPAVLSCAERLCDPAKVPEAGRLAVDPTRIMRMDAAALGPGDWGAEGSPTRVGAVRVLKHDRVGSRALGALPAQIEQAVDCLVARGALDIGTQHAKDAEDAEEVVPADYDRHCRGPMVCVLVDGRRPRLAQELLGTAAVLAAAGRGRVCAITSDSDADPAVLTSWGADEIVVLVGADHEDDVAQAVGRFAERVSPWAFLAPSTTWGRHVTARIAAHLGAGLTGDAAVLEQIDGRLVAWKPAFGGRLLASIHCDSPVQLVTVRSGVLPRRKPRASHVPSVATEFVQASGRIETLARSVDDAPDVLANAPRVVGVGQGVAFEDYALLQPLLDCLGAELGATRKVTDRGWLPRSRQIGITGQSIASRLYVAIGISGRFNHVVGVQQSGTILSINQDPDAEMVGRSDLSITADWRDAVPLLTETIRAYVGS
jgi:electron transfer flavoprotein alpha subunit